MKFTLKRYRSVNFLFKKCVLILLVLGNSSCTVIHVDGKSPEVHLYPGFAYIEFPDASGIQNITISSTGMSASNHGLYLGYYGNTTTNIYDPEVCSVIFFVSNVNEFKRIEEYVTRANGSLNDICIAKGE